MYLALFYACTQILTENLIVSTLVTKEKLNFINNVKKIKNDKCKPQ